jgi:hypothetical protein
MIQISLSDITLVSPVFDLIELSGSVCSIAFLQIFKKSTLKNQNLVKWPKVTVLTVIRLVLIMKPDSPRPMNTLYNHTTLNSVSRVGPGHWSEVRLWDAIR